jgi:exopolysaccharide production protein ExoQ
MGPTALRPRSRAGGSLILPSVGVLLPPLAVFAPLGAAPLLIVAAVASLATDWPRIRSQLGALRELAALLAALGLWGAFSASWSILPAHSLSEGLRFLAESAAGIILVSGALATTSGERRGIAIASLAGVGLAIFLLLIERFGGAPITRHALGLAASQVVPLERFDRGITVLVLAIWPAFSLRRGWLRFVLMILVAGLSLVMASGAAMFAFFVSLAAYGVARIAPRLAAAAMFGGVLLMSVALPLEIPSYDVTVSLHRAAPWIKDSGIHRLLIWRFAADRIAERPILGWGMDASRELPGGHTDLSETLPGLGFPYHIEAMSLHPHDAALQLLLELGLPGIALGMAVIGWGLWRVGYRARLSPERRAGALAWAAAGLVVGLLSFGIWQSWWLSTLWLTAALYAATAQSDA